jgi:hypothetical protein
MINLIFIFALINGYLFIAIPIFIEKPFHDQPNCLEALLFVNNYEFCNYNVIRYLILLVAAIWFKGFIPTGYYLALLTLSICLTILTTLDGVNRFTKRFAQLEPTNKSILCGK